MVELGGSAGISRRGLFGMAAGAAALAALPAGARAATPGAAPAVAAADFATMRAQWRAQHVTSGYDPADPRVAAVLSRITGDGQHWWSTMAKGAGRTYLWSDAVLSAQQSFAISMSFD